MSISFHGRSGCEMYLQTRSVRGNSVTVTEFLPLNFFTGSLDRVYWLPISPITESKRRIA